MNVRILNGRATPRGRGLARVILLATAAGLGVGSAAFADQVAPLVPMTSAMKMGANDADAAKIIVLAEADLSPKAAPSSSTSATAVVLADASSSALVGPPAQASNPMDHLGSNFFQRFWNYEKLEWGQAGPPSDPNAPPSRRAGIPAQPQSTPPMPFTEWPYGATTSLMTNRTASADSPLMVAIAPSAVGKWLSSTGIQAYGWIDYGGNLTSSKVKGGNAPAAYDYQPNSISLDQAVLYVERTPDTVQTDHIDWGFRVSGIVGTNYRYTTSYGVASYQLLKHNFGQGYDFPMVYGELYVPKIADGLLIRVGRFISIPDIEAQLAPNNYMYSHSIAYTFDNYTNTGFVASLALNKNVFLQFGVSVGSDTALWNVNKKVNNPFPNALYPGATFLKDPGAQPSYTGCARFQSNSGKDDIYFCADAINNGAWGYNNLQWYGVTYYHKFNDKWHISIESYNLHQDGVPNVLNSVATNAIANGGTPFSPQYLPFNAPNGAQCKNPAVIRCKASAQSFVDYLNYQPTPLDNISLRTEYYDDMQGQRTGTPAIYYEAALGWQHWLSPQIEMRPEVAYYHSSRAAFNGNSNLGIAPNKDHQLVLSGDIIVHF